jgi:hypothetical protein
MICSSVDRLFFIVSSLVQFTSKLQLQVVEISGGTSESLIRSGTLREEYRSQGGLPGAGKPEKWLPHRIVANDLGIGWVGVQTRPQFDVALLIARQAGEQESRRTNRQRVEVLDILLVRPRISIIQKRVQESGAFAEAAAIG